MALPSAIPAPDARASGANQGRGDTMDKGNAKKGINYTSEPIKLLRVDIECIHCNWRSIERLPFVLDGSDHWLECPECGKSSRFELAIIKYLGESE